MRLTFFGGSEGVTGSCFLLENNNRKILIDCGMYQGEADMSRVSEFDFLPNKIDAVVLTHAHYDHCGRLPLLIKQGFSGKIFCTPPTKPLVEIILEDAQQVMTEMNRRDGSPILFSLDDVKQTCSQMFPINYHTNFEPMSGSMASFYDAGHILGSAFARIESQGKSIVFSGDIGNESIPILPETEKLTKTDCVVCETTYGDREHEDSSERSKKLSDVISKVLSRGGTLLIPAFSIERTQELLYELDGLIDAGKIPGSRIYLDSPLSIKATKIYNQFASYLKFDRNIFSSPDKDFFSFPILHSTLSIDDSKIINDDPHPKIIIAGAGMLNGGRILHHLKRYISDERSGILFIGYQAQGTLGRQIFDKASQVRIHKDKYEVKLEVCAIGAFSAHADRVKLRSWLCDSPSQINKIFLVHGEEQAKESFKKYLEDKQKLDIEIPKFSQQFELYT